MTTIKVKRQRKQLKKVQGIFEINEYQLSILRLNCEGQKYIGLIPDSKKDGEVFGALVNFRRWEDELVEQGLLMELETEDDEVVKRMETTYNRKYRMFRLTPLALAMFTPVLVQGTDPETFRNVADTIH